MGITIAGGHGHGDGLDQLYRPHSLCVHDKDNMVFIADSCNHRIVAWKQNDNSVGWVVAGGNGKGNRLDQLSMPTDLLIDQASDSLIICDRGNRRVLRWPLQNDSSQGEIIIEQINCYGLTIDDDRNIYITDTDSGKVRRYRGGEQTSGKLWMEDKEWEYYNHQFNRPHHVFINNEGTLYVSDNNFHLVTKLVKGATTKLVAGNGKIGKGLTGLWYPQGVFVDTEGTIYVADQVINA